MRFKDYIINKAIKISYDRIIKNKDSKILPIDNVFVSASKKLGYKILDEEVIKNHCPCENQEWKKILERTSYKEGYRFLEWNTEKKSSIYFNENGQLFFGVNGLRFDFISILQHNDLYEKYKDFLEFSRNYFKKAKTIKNQYLLLGIDKNDDRYYICSDNNFYKKIGDVGGYIICDDNEKEVANKYLLSLG